MLNSLLSNLRWKKYLNNERGNVADILTFGITLALFTTVVVFVVNMIMFIVVVFELNDVSDNVMKDSIQINHGLTSETESYILDILEEKGYDTSRVTITGDYAGSVNFGDVVQGSIVYEYDFPLFQGARNLFPFVTIERIPIEAPIITRALGVQR